MTVASPTGQSTILWLDANGYLARVANAAGEKLSFTYLDGLMVSLTDAASRVHRFTYDSAGRLVRDENPAGGVTTIAHASLISSGLVSDTVATTSVMGRTTTYRSDRSPDGTQLQSLVSPDGARDEATIKSDGTQSHTVAGGMKTTTKIAGDPRFCHRRSEPGPRPSPSPGTRGPPGDFKRHDSLGRSTSKATDGHSGGLTSVLRLRSTLHRGHAAPAPPDCSPRAGTRNVPTLRRALKREHLSRGPRVRDDPMKLVPSEAVGDRSRRSLHGGLVRARRAWLAPKLMPSPAPLGFANSATR